MYVINHRLLNSAMYHSCVISYKWVSYDIYVCIVLYIFNLLLHSYLSVSICIIMCKYAFFLDKKKFSHIHVHFTICCFVTAVNFNADATCWYQLLIIDNAWLDKGVCFCIIYTTLFWRFGCQIWALIGPECPIRTNNKHVTFCRIKMEWKLS